MLRIVCLLASLCAAAPAAYAQASAPADPESALTPEAQAAIEQTVPAQPEAVSVAANAMQQANIAFAQCARTGIGNVPDSVSPEAGAARIMVDCSAQRDEVERAAYALVAALPENQHMIGEQQARTQIAAIESQIASAIRERRSSPPSATSQP